ncbi:hypothetical protein F511_05006 [Dorcoceras hygrometricum]|uniref:Uncharacterized protein n=1 Tax=Dorcoceras hygrometricum TaxID=472368 RepID=A0A2Z7AV08_9LAMI|nr:hypothetical protein F511_05006 [Dorcoceras hygrometricum]
MDLEQEEMQFLGVFGVYLEAYKLIFRWRKIFSQITLALILPLAFIFLAHEEVSTVLYWKIRFNEFRLRHAEAGTPKYDRISDLVSSEWAIYILLKGLYFTFLLVFSLLSTSAVVYTVACAYTSREITFRKVMSVVPKVWKRVMVTFLCAFLAVFCYNMLFALTMFLWVVSLDYIQGLGLGVLMLILMIYPIGFVYMTIIWQLASVVSVLEDSYGFKAMIKSKDLIKGKMFVASVVFLILNLSLGVIYWVFRACVVFGWRYAGTIQIIGYGALCLLLLFKLILFALVLQTIIYFVCKSYHHENIDKSALSDHLEAYLGDYVPLKAQDVQLEEYHV